MSAKKVSFGPKPAKQVESWVSDRNEPAKEAEQVKVKLKRLTIDIAPELHLAIKSQCVARGTNMAEEIRELLEQRYGNQ